MFVRVRSCKHLKEKGADLNRSLILLLVFENHITLNIPIKQPIAKHKANAMIGKPDN